MKEIVITVSKKIATASDSDYIVTGNDDVCVRFVFDDEWEDSGTKTAVFIMSDGSACYEVLRDDRCVAPPLYNTSYVKIGVIGAAVCTSTSATVKCLPCVTDEILCRGQINKDAYTALSSLIDARVPTPTAAGNVLVADENGNGEWAARTSVFNGYTKQETDVLLSRRAYMRRVNKAAADTVELSDVDDYVLDNVNSISFICGAASESNILLTTAAAGKVEVSFDGVTAYNGDYAGAVGNGELWAFTVKSRCLFSKRLSGSPAASSDLAAVFANAQTAVEYVQENTYVKGYLDSTHYTDDYSVTNVPTYAAAVDGVRKDHPNGVGVNLYDKGRLTLSDGGSYTAYAKDSTEGKNTLYNLTPSATSGWWNTVKGRTAQVGAVKPTGACRMIYATPTETPVKNVRDLGGWSCDGGTVRYGMLYRGGALYANTSTLTVSMADEDKAMFRNLLGIKHELDLRVASELSDQAGSALGDGVEYTNVPVGAITDPDYSLMVDINGDYAAQIKDIITTVFTSVFNGKPLYFHCSYGADRTGVVAFILNGLLGVSQSDLDRDYELTSFCGELRYRTAAMYKDFVAYFNNFSGDSIRDKLVNWCVAIGISIDDVNRFRRKMINGTPALLEAYVPQTKNLVSSAISAADGSIYNGTGYKNGVYISSTGATQADAVSAAEGVTTTGLMPLQRTFYVKGGTWDSTNSNCRIAVYDSNRNWLIYSKATALASGGLTVEEQANGSFIFTLKPTVYADYTWTYLRISLLGNGAELIVSDEPIE